MKINYEKYQKDLLDDLQTLIRIPTTYDEKSFSSSAPYGKNLQAGLDFIRAIAKRDGFEVLEYDNHALAVCYGKGSERIDVINHIDVVEPGSGWDDDPFSGLVKDGRLYGRGTQDMKSSTMATYYALKIIKDLNIKLSKEVRIVFGTDEERTMKDIEYYISKAGQPTFAFTPDGRFPYCRCEKGSLMWTISGEVNSIIKSFKGGVGCNIVPDFAEVKLKDKLTVTKNISGVEYNDDSLKVCGKTAHASTPYLGDNAIIKALKFIKDNSDDALACQLYDVLKDETSLGYVGCYDAKEYGDLTINLGILNILDGELFGQIDSRYPYGLNSQAMTEKMRELLKPLKVDLDFDAKATFISPDNIYCQKLLEVYREFTDDDSLPYLSGGVTYSKVVDNCVAYGPGLKDSVILAHQANEYIELSELWSVLPIYTKALLELGRL